MQVSIQQFRKSTMIIIALLLTGLLAIAILFFLKPMNQRTPVSVTAIPVSTVNKPLRIERTVLVAHATMVPVYSEGAGRVSAIYIKLGQAVKAGQPLIKLDITGGGDETIAAPSSALVEVSSAEKDAYENALKDYNKYQILYEQGAIARKQLEAAQARLQSTQATMQNQPVKANTNLSGPVTILASIDGTITGSVVNAGSTIQAGQELMALGSGQDIEIVVSLAESELYFIQLGSQAIIAVAGQQLAGQVSGIYPEVKDKQNSVFYGAHKTNTDTSNSTNTGNACSVHIAPGQEVGTIAVPPQAVSRDEEGQYFIFSAIEGKAVRQQVTIGETIGNLLEMTTALPQGSLVITSHIDQLKSGDTVTVVQ